MIISSGGLAIAAAAGVWFLQAGGASASDEATKAAQAAGFDSKEQAAIEAIVRSYILENPEIIPEAVEILQNRQQSAAIEDIRTAIETPFAGNAFAGNPN